jgi:hypothetical protein
MKRDMEIEKTRVKEERRDGVTPILRQPIRTVEQARKLGYCGAKRAPGPEGVNKGKRCMQKAGSGTDHPGIGYCRLHGGNVPTQKLNAAKQEAILMGAPKAINPLDAIVWCIHITAGEVEFCTEQLEQLEQGDWTEHTVIGKQINIWAKERQNAVSRLMKFSATAVQIGLSERAIRIAEQYGHSIARYTRGLLAELDPHISEEGKKLLPGIVKRQLIILQGGDPSNGVIPKSHFELPVIDQEAS